MDSKYLNINFKARYYSCSELTDDTEYILLALHGYGQLASYFSRHFKNLDNKIYTLVPEGMHRFYLNGMSGRVGASWMTKEDRLVDIENQFNFLDTLVNKCEIEKRKNLKLIVLGFSQGVSTAIRWMSKSEITPFAFISWAGSFPVDLNTEEIERAFNNVKMIQVIGDNDPYFDAKARENQQSWLSKNNIERENLEFKGEHRIDSVFLQKLISNRIFD